MGMNKFEGMSKLYGQWQFINNAKKKDLLYVELHRHQIAIEEESGLIHRTLRYK